MRKIIFNILTILRVGVRLRNLRVKNKEVTVLMFHRVSDEHDFLSPPMPVNTFEQLIKILSIQTNIIPIEQFDSIHSYSDKPLVIISFDDGYEDFYQNVLPILLKYNVPAHLNVCPGLIDSHKLPWTQILDYYIQKNPNKNLMLPNGKSIVIPKQVNEVFFNSICKILYTTDEKSREEFSSELEKAVGTLPVQLLSWDKLNECAKQNIHIGCHSMTHSNLSEMNGEDNLTYEIVESKKKIEEKIGTMPLVFAFPNGLFSQESLRVATEEYKFVLLCDDMVSVFKPKQPFYIFPRINIAQTDYKEEYLRSLGFHQALKKIFNKKSYVFNSESIFFRK